MLEDFWKKKQKKKKKHTNTHKKKKKKKKLRVCKMPISRHSDDQADNVIGVVLIVFWSI